MWKRRDNVEKPSPSARLSSPLTQCGRRTGFFRTLLLNICGSSSFVNNFLQETAECPPIPISERTTDGWKTRPRERGAAYLRRLWASPAVASGDGRTDGSSARRRRRRRRRRHRAVRDVDEQSANKCNERTTCSFVARSSPMPHPISELFNSLRLSRFASWTRNGREAMS